MLQIENSFILTSEELRELLEKAFSNGALSHAKWDGQTNEGVFKCVYNS